VFGIHLQRKMPPVIGGGGISVEIHFGAMQILEFTNDLAIPSIAEPLIRPIVDVL
jgi:hypothetical protein